MRIAQALVAFATFSLLVVMAEELSVAAASDPESAVAHSTDGAEAKDSATALHAAAPGVATGDTAPSEAAPLPTDESVPVASGAGQGRTEAASADAQADSADADVAAQLPAVPPPPPPPQPPPASASSSVVPAVPTKPRSSVDTVKINYALKDKGADVLEFGPNTKGAGNLIIRDSDKYCITPCDERLMVVGCAWQANVLTELRPIPVPRWLCINLHPLLVCSGHSTLRGHHDGEVRAR